ncbi:MAG: 2,3-bisphosphoglycerate-independent phosphoglycerate mutase, partial [Verrucomicrobiales bacterium]
MPKPTILIIRDGWGVNPDGPANAAQNGDATLLADTPFHEQLYSKYPQSRVSASGLDVGLPDGQMGNSEVGHLNLGAGRIVYQDLTRINLCIEKEELASVPKLSEAFDKAKGRRLHLIGLVSDGGVHSHQDHLIALAKAAHEAGVEEIAVHAITDGRDTSPTGGKDYLAYCEERLAPYNAKIITVVGRYYA